MDKKKWLRETIAYLVLCLAVFAVVMVVVDPYFHYHKPMKGISYRLLEQRYINDGIARHFEYDSIILGTSMVENFKTSEFDEKFGTNSVKLSFSGASYHELSQNLERAFSYNPDIKNVLWCLDWTLLIQEADYQSYTELPEYLYDDNPLNDVNYLLNKEIMYRGTLNNLWMTLKGEPSMTFDEYSARYGETGLDVLLKNYNRRKKKKENRQLTSEKRLLVEENIKSNVIPLIEANPDTTFYLYFPPYSLLRFDEWNRMGTIEVYIEAAELATELLLPYDNVKLYCFYENTELVGEWEHYKDGIHYDFTVNSKILSWIANDKYRITEDNYKEHTKKEEAFYLNYDYDSIFE